MGTDDIPDHVWVGYAKKPPYLPQAVADTAEELAELCGLSKNAVARYERGERVPDIRTARALADFFNVSLDELVGR